MNEFERATAHGVSQPPRALRSLVVQTFVVVMAAMATHEAVGREIATTRATAATMADDLTLALTELTEEERQVYLASAERVTLLAERIALARERRSAERGLTNQQLAAAELEGQLGRYTFARRIRAAAAVRSTASQTRIAARAEELLQSKHAACDVPARYSGSHILIRVDNRPLKDAVARANEVAEKLKAGTSFAEIAQQYSEDTGSAKNGGVLPPFAKGDIEPLFARQYFSDLTPNRISEPFLGRFGIHVLKVGDKTIPPSQMARDECIPILRKKAEAELMDEALKAQHREIVAAADLKVSDDAVAEIVKANAPPPRKPGEEKRLIESALRLYEQQRAADQRGTPEKK